MKKSVFAILILAAASGFAAVNSENGSRGSIELAASEPPCSGTNKVTECTESALRSAISLGGTVTFCCNGTIVLTNPIVVSNIVTLDGTNSSVVISGGGLVRLFDVRAGAKLTAKFLTFSDGAFI